MLIPECSVREMSDLGLGKGEEKQSLKGRQKKKKLRNYPEDDDALSREELKERSQRVFT